VLLDAAIRVLGERGVRAVTHRAVDAEARLGIGSTANLFASRDALFAAIVERFAERERRNFEDLAVTVSPRSPDELGRVLGAAVLDGVGLNRTLTLCRYALLVESANNPTLREQIAVTGARVGAWMTNWLRAIGCRDPDRDVHLLGNYVTGMVLHQLAMPDPIFDPTDKLVALLEGLVADEPAGLARHEP